MKKASLFRLLLAVSVTALLLLSCSSSTEPRVATLNIERVLDNNSSYVFQGIIEVESIIALETTDLSLLSEIRKIIAVDNLLFILDIDGKLKLFDMQGNFIRELGQKGEGPGEYPSLTDFAIDRDREEVLINSVQKVLIYDYEGNFKRDINLADDNLQVFTYCNNNLYYIFPDKSYPNEIESATLITVLDLDGNLQKEIPANELRRVGDIPFFNNIATDGNTVYYKEELGQALYAINNDFSVESVCLLDFGKYAFQPNDFQFSKHEVWEERYRLQNIIPATDYMFFILQKGLIGQELNPVIWSKKDNMVSHFHQKVSHKGEELSVVPFAVSNNKVIGVLGMPEDSLDADNPVVVVLEIGV